MKRLQDAWFNKHGDELCTIVLAVDWLVRSSHDADKELHEMNMPVFTDMIAVYCEARGISEEAFSAAFKDLQRDIETSDILSKIPD